MAIAVGDEVALARAAGDATTLEARGDVLFGIVYDTASNNSILWENGQVSTGIPSARLDLIIGSTNQQAEVVGFGDSGNQNSPEYHGVVARCYSRNPAGAGSATVYVKMLSKNGQYYEVPALAIAPVAGQ